MRLCFDEIFVDPDPAQVTHAVRLAQQCADDEGAHNRLGMFGADDMARRFRAAFCERRQTSGALWRAGAPGAPPGIDAWGGAAGSVLACAWFSMPSGRRHVRVVSTRLGHEGPHALARVMGTHRPDPHAVSYVYPALRETELSPDEATRARHPAEIVALTDAVRDAPLDLAARCALADRLAEAGADYALWAGCSLERARRLALLLRDDRAAGAPAPAEESEAGA
jgi:hypothetical protein